MGEDTLRRETSTEDVLLKIQWQVGSRLLKRIWWAAAIHLCFLGDGSGGAPYGFQAGELVCFTPYCCF